MAPSNSGSDLVVSCSTVPLLQGLGPPLLHVWPALASCPLFHGPCNDPGPVPLHGPGPPPSWTFCCFVWMLHLGRQELPVEGVSVTPVLGLFHDVSVLLPLPSSLPCVCVMFWLVVLIMCPVSHWLILVMLPVLFAICSHHVAIVSCNVLMLDLLSVSLVCPCQFKSVSCQVRL